jgi:hypothetical protein
LHAEEHDVGERDRFDSADGTIINRRQYSFAGTTALLSSFRIDPVILQRRPCWGLASIARKTLVGVPGAFPKCAERIAHWLIVPTNQADLQGFWQVEELAT